jgi:RNA-directed DNA polymerase
MKISFQEIVVAYYDCRKNKKNKMSSLSFELNLEANLFTLYEDLLRGSYKISPHTVFVVEQPKAREIWASSFRDRIVHHILYNRLVSKVVKDFIPTSYACIKNRGTFKALKDLKKGIEKLGGFHPQGYYLKADIHNYFVSIDKNILWNLLDPYLTDKVTRQLAKIILFHDVRENPIKKSKPEVFKRVPAYKSLFFSKKEKGLPIGNLTSQFFANIYLNELDQFVTRKLGYSNLTYFRYVDDFILLSSSKKNLKKDLLKIEVFLLQKLQLKLHPYKVKIDSLEKGVDFVGYFHRYNQVFIRPRIIQKFKSIKNQYLKGLYRNHTRFQQQLNSYLGRLKWAKTFTLRKNIITSLIGKVPFWKTTPEFNKINYCFKSFKYLKDYGNKQI